MFKFKYEQSFIVLKPLLERCDPSQLSNVVIAETPILEDRGDESESGPYTSISTLWENVLLLGTQEGELITAQRSTVDDPKQRYNYTITETRYILYVTYRNVFVYEHVGCWNIHFAILFTRQIQKADT